MSRMYDNGRRLHDRDIEFPSGRGFVPKGRDNFKDIESHHINFAYMIEVKRHPDQTVIVTSQAMADSVISTFPLHWQVKVTPVTIKHDSFLTFEGVDSQNG